MLADLERAEACGLLHGTRAALRRVFEHVFRLWAAAGVRVVARDPFRQQRDPHDLEQIVGVVVGAVRDRTARRSQRGNRRDDAAIGGHRRLMGDDGAGAREQRDVGRVDVAAVRREQPCTEEAVPVEERRRTNAVVPHHEIDLGDALRQMDRVSEVVFVGEGAHRLQQFRRRSLGQRGGREDADASLILAVPRGEQIVDALHALVAQLRREPRRLAGRESLRRHRPGHVLAVADRLREHAAQT